MKIRTCQVSRSNSPSATRLHDPEPATDLRLVGEVGVGGPVGLPALNGAAQALERAFQRGHRDRLPLEDQLVQRERAERRAQGVDLEHVDGADLGHDRAAVGDPPRRSRRARACAARRGSGPREMSSSAASGISLIRSPGLKRPPQDRVAHRVGGDVYVPRRCRHQTMLSSGLQVAAVEAVDAERRDVDEGPRGAGRGRAGSRPWPGPGSRGRRSRWRRGSATRRRPRR